MFAGVCPFTVTTVVHMGERSGRFPDSFQNSFTTTSVPPTPLLFHFIVLQAQKTKQSLSLSTLSVDLQIAIPLQVWNI